jgi:hypothetical protein
MAGTAAIIFGVITIGLAMFQLNLAFGAPWGRLAWGGQHERLPMPLRIGSGVSILVYGLCATILLARAGQIELWTGADWLGTVSWVIATFLGLGILANLASRSLPERLVMTPVAAIMCLCVVLVALGA